MTEPTTPELDQAIINAGKELVRAHLDDVPDPKRIKAAREELERARAARWPDE